MGSCHNNSLNLTIRSLLLTYIKQLDLWFYRLEAQCYFQNKAVSFKEKMSKDSFDVDSLINTVCCELVFEVISALRCKDHCAVIVMRKKGKKANHF